MYCRVQGATILQPDRDAVLDHEHRELGLYRLQHDPHLHSPPIDPNRAVRGGTCRQSLGGADRVVDQDSRAIRPALLLTVIFSVIGFFQLFTNRS
jgi:hypothetical protein